MSALAARRKEIHNDIPVLRHRAPQCNRRIHHILTDSAFAYVWWLEELAQYLATSPYESMVNLQLPPQEPTTAYAEQCRQCLENCEGNPEANRQLNNFISESVDALLIRLMQHPTASENVEVIKLHFAAMMDPFRMLVFERSLACNSSDLLSFFRALDGMGKVYYHIFRVAPTDDLRVQWMMTALNNDIFANEAILGEIQANWAQLYNNPQEIRRIINHHLHHLHHRQ